MDKQKRERLESRGWSVGSVEDFLELTAEESAYIAMKLVLSENLKKKRLEKRLTQAELAKLLRSSQSRVAKMELGDSSVSLDLLIRSLLALGATTKDIAGMISRQETVPATWT